MHAANHPGTRHYCQSILSIDPLDATEGRPVALVWFSPDCKHHSKAKGGKPRDKNIRDLAHVVPHWIERLKKATPGGRGKPRVIALENVEEFRQWGPLDEHGKPIADRKGEEFRLWVARIRRQGYKVEWRELRACDYGAPTSRKRLFLVARCDGLPIVWPEPTHGKPGSPEVLSGKRLPWRTAAECIDWSLPCPSIFDRKKPLEEATCRRIAAGVMRYVVNSARPFIVPVTHRGDVRVHSADEPLRTITTAKRGEFAAVVPHVASLANRDKPFTAADEPMHTVVATGCKKALVGSALVKLRNNCIGQDPREPIDTVTTGGHFGAIAATMVQTGYGERGGQAPRALDIEQPLGTVVAGGAKHGAVSAFLSHYYTSNTNGGRGQPDLPHKTICTGGQGRVMTAHLEQANTGAIGHDMREPASTITMRGTQQRLIETTLVEADALPSELMAQAVRTAAFLVKYYGSEVGQHQTVDAPIDTIPTKARFAVITVKIDATTFVLVDIGMRMLMPRELANAQGFPPDYILDPICTYRTDAGNLKTGRLPKSHQIAKIGNSVCPVMAEALARANLPELCVGADELREVAA